jgi:membrane protein implicated in regulation of membrane protease activity
MAAWVYVGMVVVGIAYAAMVYWLREADPDHGLTPWLVVVGDGLIVVGMFLLFGAEVAIALVTLLALAGAPQVIGYYIARIRSKRKGGLRLDGQLYTEGRWERVAATPDGDSAA